ncbi:MAG: LacI family DNA-binding transcriptional regulator [Chloroflexota bacterium]
MRKKPSITDVAKLAGVSRTTVSYVLNNVTGIHISEQTRQRVLDSARELDYHPNAVARSLARKKTLTLGLVLCANLDRLNSDAFLPGVIYGIGSITAPAGFRLLVEVVDDVSRPNAYTSLIREFHSDGIILAGVRPDDHQLDGLNADDFPVVLWGKLPNSSLPFVDVDNVSAARMAVEHLIALGQTRIACITNASPASAHEAADRLYGYQSALEAHGLFYDETLVRFGDYRERSGFEAMSSLLALPERPSAVFVASDVVALGALSAARNAGLSVPHDLAVVGFDDIQLSQYVVPPLTTVRVPAHEIGATSAQMLLNIIQNGHRPASVFLATELIVRESCGANVYNTV